MFTTENNQVLDKQSDLFATCTNAAFAELACDMINKACRLNDKRKYTARRIQTPPLHRRSGGADIRGT
jgi:hypothetical protein